MIEVMTDQVARLGSSQDPRIERTRAHVLGHARKLLSTDGPSAVTYSELAARARVTRQTLYRHWPTREALVVDLVLEQSMAGLPDGSGTPEQMVGEFLRRLRDDMGDPAYSAPLLALIAQADYEPTSRSALKQVVVGVRSALNTLLEPAGVCVTPEDYARLCGPVIFGRVIAREPITDLFIDDLVAAWSQSKMADQTNQATGPLRSR
jgi:AcrR family transcriptional regulator